MSGKEKKEGFEDLLAEAEKAVEALESGELPLEESMTRYELGVRNLKKCAALIEEAQKKVEQLIQNKQGELELTEFDKEDEK